MKKLIMITASVCFAGVILAQKKSETDAALAFKQAESAMNIGDMEGAKKNLVKAKTAIDLAAANAETMSSPKTLFYKGEIYATIAYVSITDSTNSFGVNSSEARNLAVSAYKASYSGSPKFKEDIENSVRTIQQMSYQIGSTADEKKMYPMGIEAFKASAAYMDAIGQIDTTALYYVGLLSEKNNDFNGAAEYYKQVAQLNYRPADTYSAAGIALLKAGKQAEAVEFLKQAIDKNPKDKFLYFALGTISMEMNNDDDVLKNLNKAIELDPKYTDAQYNLGVYFSDKAAKMRQEAGQLPNSAKKEYDEKMSKSLELYRMAADPLEKYADANPTDKNVMKSLFQIHKALKNTEKEAKYKALFEAAK